MNVCFYFFFLGTLGVNCWRFLLFFFFVSKNFEKNDKVERNAGFSFSPFLGIKRSPYQTIHSLSSLGFENGRKSINLLITRSDFVVPHIFLLSVFS